MNELNDDTLQRLQGLVQQLTIQREADEQPLADEVVIRFPSRLDGSAEALAVAALDIGALGEMVGASLLSGMAPPVRARRLSDRTVVLQAPHGRDLDIAPGGTRLKASRAAYLHPQWAPSLGSELASGGTIIPRSSGDALFEVSVSSPQGLPLQGVTVSGLLDIPKREWVTADTDPQGKATLYVPRTHPAVEVIFVEPVHTYWSQYVKGFLRADARPVTFSLASAVPDTFGLMASYAAYDADAGRGVKVGVIDSGVGPHDDLTVAGGGCFVSGEDPGDHRDGGLGHGTHVAGVLAAQRSAAGTYGLAPACTLMSYRVFSTGTDPHNRARSPDVAAAIHQAIEDECDLLNISLGSKEPMDEVRVAIAKARRAGIAVFVSTGNDGSHQLRYPAAYEHAVAVGALGRSGTFPPTAADRGRVGKIVDGNEFVGSFSNFGLPNTFFIGPGVAVLSTWPGNRYAVMSGTSMSTPYVTGMAARRLSRNPGVITMQRSEERAKTIVSLVTDTVSTRKPAWADVYGLYGVPI